MKDIISHIRQKEIEGLVPAKMRDKLNDQKIIDAFTKTYEILSQHYLEGQHPFGVIIETLEHVESALSRVRRLPKSPLTAFMIKELSDILNVTPNTKGDSRFYNALTSLQRENSELKSTVLDLRAKLFAGELNKLEFNDDDDD